MPEQAAGDFRIMDIWGIAFYNPRIQSKKQRGNNEKSIRPGDGYFRIGVLLVYGSDLFKC